MKKFLIISVSLLIGAIIATVATFLYVTKELPESSQESTSVTETEAVPAAPHETVEDGVPLRDLPLSDGQKSALDTVGIDVDTFVITPAMQACAADKLGAARMEEIIAGAAPSFFETTKLLPCLSVE